MIRAMIRTGVALGAMVAALATPAVQAQQETRFSTDVSATAGYANNPFSTQGDDTGAVVVALDISPRYQIETPHSVITLSADANRQQYLQRYGGNDSYSGAADYQGRPSEQLVTHARLDLSSAVLGAFSSYLPIAAGLGGLDPIAAPGVGNPSTTGAPATTGSVTAPGGATLGSGTALPVPSITALTPYTDIGLFGLRNRRKVARLSGGLGVGLSARDSVTASGYGEMARYDGLRTGDYNAFGGGLGYSRRVSDQWTAGLRGSAGSYDYRGSSADSQSYSVEATASGRLSERWTLDGALGVSFVDGGGATATHSTSVSGSLDLCRRGPFSNLCVQALRQVSPTGLAGTQYVTSVGLSWNRRLDERQNVSLGVSYSRVGSGRARLIAGSVPLQSEYAQATLGYDRRLAERLRFVASGSYRQLLGGDTERPADVAAQVGLAYRLGDTR